VQALFFLFSSLDSVNLYDSIFILQGVLG
jgi:hypothetical protein